MQSLLRSRPLSRHARATPRCLCMHQPGQWDISRRNPKIAELTQQRSGWALRFNTFSDGSRERPPAKVCSDDIKHEGSRHVCAACSVQHGGYARAEKPPYIMSKGGSPKTSIPTRFCQQQPRHGNCSSSYPSCTPHLADHGRDFNNPIHQRVCLHCKLRTFVVLDACD